MNVKEKLLQRKSRARRTHVKARMSGRTRLVVFRSNQAIYAQLVDDATGKVLGSVSSLKTKLNMEGAKEVGKKVAALAKSKKVKTVVFDRNGYRYHGKIKALAEGAREGGLEF